MATNNDFRKTVDSMLSDDYKERFNAEYWQTKIRFERLHNMLVKIEADTLPFKPKSDRYLLEQQANAMRDYLHCLEVRAEIEKINLYWGDKNDSD